MSVGFSVSVQDATPAEIAMLQALLTALTAPPAVAPVVSPPVAAPPVAAPPVAASPVVAPPAPSASVVPGSSGTVIAVGATRAIKTLAAAIAVAKPGDTIRLDQGTYAESVAPTVPLVIDGQNHAVLNGATFTAYAHGLGGIVPMADCVIQNLELTGFGMAEKTAGSTSAIRPGAPCHVTVIGCNIHDNQCGLASGGFAVTWEVQDTTLTANGLGDGATHNIYISTGTLGANFTNVSSTAPRGGHALKSRAPMLTVTGGTFQASDATPIDLPDGTATPFSIVGATLAKTATDANHGVFGYAMESHANGIAGGTLSACMIAALCANPSVQTTGGSIVFSADDRFTGNRVTAQGAGAASVRGLP